MFSPADALGNAMAKLPSGFAWLRDPVSNWGRLLTPGAAEQVIFETAAEAQLEEATPSSAAALLPDYERVLGPDPCLGPVVASLQERRQSAHARWTALGGASRQHYIDLAAHYGYAITIYEFRPARVGTFRVGQPLLTDSVPHTWRVRAPATEVVYFRTGQSTAGQALARAGIAVLECVLRRAAPAHTTLIVSFGA